MKKLLLPTNVFRKAFLGMDKNIFLHSIPIIIKKLNKKFTWRCPYIFEKADVCGHIKVYETWPRDTSINYHSRQQWQIICSCQITQLRIENDQRDRAHQRSPYHSIK